MSIYPSLTDVKHLAQHYSFIPVCKTIVVDTETPVSLYHRMLQESYSFLLESVEGGEKWSRYSYIGADPFLIVKGQNGKFQLKSRDRRDIQMTFDPINLVQQLLDEHHAPQYEGYPPFLGGAVGTIGYESIRYFEPNRPLIQEDQLFHHHDFHLMFVDRMIVFDHLKQQVLFVGFLKVVEEMDTEALTIGYEQLTEELKEWAVAFIRQSKQILPIETVDLTEQPIRNASVNMSKNTYIEKVKQAKAYIDSGDVFQVVLSQKWTMDDPPDPMLTYRILRILNPSPYMYYLRLDDEVIVGSSPELLVRVHDRKVGIRPIAGSRPRGKGRDEDNRLKESLLADEKECAEHMMLVDLGRNDLGRIARFGSVQVSDLKSIEKYSHVMHMVSHVSATLDEPYRELDAFAAAFPAGTLSGAPKIRAMEIIAELEPEPRGIYGGAIGYFSFTGNIDACIAIRTIHFKDQRATVQAGAGVVTDSDPEAEYQETVNKAKGALLSLEIAKSYRAVEGAV
ncbi:anthranilate synthase component I [Hazenella sp. IB182357]|uniref:Anthranilate synthase component 1 n=1 Tax=Polycladospora coralii TaxID=2771432 RepID=A0A926NAF7_9BACL|nr:anthranilate synthase component I [Polycladospora coralii]MBD1371615.1 anthranilate synthase component I [Polycladospora coralii]